jgi:alanine racemase
MSKYNTYAEINLAHLRHNYKEIKKLCGDKTIISVVKADAYGHGAAACTKALSEEGCGYFAVASIAEAKELRQAGIALPILVLGYIPAERIEEALQFKLTMTVYDVDFACAVSNACKKLNCNAKVHVKINTGMNRLGLVPETAAQKIEKIHRLYGIEIEGIFSHYATADEEDLSYSRAQFEKFKDVVGRIKALGITPPLIHISNSASILKCQDDISTAVRPGIILYGILPCEAAAGLKPVMTFYSKVAAVNTYDTDVVVSYGRKYVAHAQSKLATVCAGYADGYFRALTNKSEIYIKGRRYKTVGTICMDMFMADISGTDDIAVGDRVELFGDHVTADELAQLADTIPYEILCSVSKRVRREYVF